MSDATPILFICPVFQYSGAEQIVIELARGLKSHGFAPSVLCLEDEREVVGQELQKAGIPFAGLRLWRRRAIACAKAIPKHIPAGRPAIVHSHLFHANLAARLAMKRLRDARAGVHL